MQLEKMNEKLNELLALAKVNNLIGRKEEIVEEEKGCDVKKTIIWVLAIIGAVAAVAGIAYAVYRYFEPDYLEDFDDEFDDFDDDIYDEKDE